jgi:hypothetical protein
MRWIWTVLMLAACNQDGAPCPCGSADQSCVYLGTNAPVCQPNCTADGGCGGGQTCTCAPTCLSCADCKNVCS